MKKFALVAVATAFILVGCKTAEQSLQEAGAKPLAAAEVKSMIVGNTTSVTMESGTNSTAFFRSNGTMFAKNSRGNSSGGTWEVKQDGQLCTMWEKWGSKCVKIYPSGVEFKEIDEGGNLYLTIKQVRKGNPEGF